MALLTDKEVDVTLAGLPPEERQMILELLSEVQERMLTPEKLREWDAKEIFPEAQIRELIGPDIGLQMLFIPEEYGGMGGGARDLAAFSEQMAKICLGVGTAFLVLHLGSDPILVAGTDAQKQKWLTKMVEEGSIVAYAVTEAEAGSNLSNLKTTATPVLDGGGTITGYRINGTKQFISNGGYADFLTVLAVAPEGPSFFIVEKTMDGFAAGKPEEKHGIRSSNTAPLTFDDVFVPAENLVGGVPGRGLSQANEVFGFTRLMVACCGMGAGVAALEKVVPYAKERVQFGSPLVEKQGYTHKLILPYVARLEAARAYIEEVCLRLDSGEKDLQVEGAVAKLFGTEVGNACADSAIQALGGYGYIREYDVEKIKRDVKITTIYEGTSEIQQLIVSTLRWRESVKLKGQFYDDLAAQLDAVHEAHCNLKGDVLAALARLVGRLFDEVHQTKLTRKQHIMFRLASMTTLVETGAALCAKAADVAASLPKFVDTQGVTVGLAIEPSARQEYLVLCARINAALCGQEAFVIANEILFGSGQWTVDEALSILTSSNFDFAASQTGLVSDMDLLRTKI
ncbi:MAG: acyl-CoA dehydrogenase family protein [Actinobacteria bacterium]|nr:acyl-CoA dehydrogenase family protein [Actinomycetota bacterium]